MGKRRGINRLDIQKYIVFILVLVFFTGLIASAFEFLRNSSSGFSIIVEDSYYESDEYSRESSKIVNILDVLITEYRSEDYINNEKRIFTKDGYLEDGYYGDSYYNHHIEDLYNEYQYRAYDKGELGYDDNLSDEENYSRFELAYEEEINKIEELAKKQLIREMKKREKFLEELEGVVYYATNGKEVFSNASSTNVKAEHFDKFAANILVDNEEGYRVKPENARYIINYRGDSQLNLTDLEHTVYVGFTDEYLNPRIKAWENEKNMGFDDIKKVIGFGLGLALSFIGLLIITGRTSDENVRVEMRGIDRLYTDINIIICGFIIFTWFACVAFFNEIGIISLSSVSQVGDGHLEKITSSPIFLGITFVLGGIGLYFVLSLVRHIKNRTFFKHSMIGRVFGKILNFLREMVNSSSIGKKVIGGLIIYPLALAITFFVFPLTIGFFIWQALKKVKEFEAIKEGVKEIKAGDLDYQIEIDKDGEFKKLADDINEIGQGLKSAVDNELKSERHKAELITNVSHDIRTPLTSIITYVDLLKQEEDEEKKKDYIEVLDQKSDRLKKLIDDLFEASKVSSGNIPVNLSRIDIASIMNQGLGELNDEIERNKLDFRLSFEEEEMFVKADGDLLWRAIENLLSNIFKYGLKGSRVYVDIEEDGENINLVIKNISAYELNITEEELMERFKRGDESRTSEGSGLGLSIAESLIDVQGGVFTIEIDGDLFKTIISLPKCR